MFDARVHAAVLRGIVERGYPPSVSQTAQALGATEGEVEGALRRLEEGHGLVLHPRKTSVWIAHPFSASPTGTWVQGAERGWWAPCMWCALGIACLVPGEVTVHARIGGETEAVALKLRAGELVHERDGDMVVHFAYRPVEAWDNVVHFCATVLPFHAAGEARMWATRHGLPFGEAVKVTQVLALARAWYGTHLREDWRKWTVPEARAIFGGVGLSGAFWALPERDGEF